MLDRCPEIHGHGSNLDFRKNLFFTMNQLNGIFDDHMVAAVSWGLDVGHIVAFFHNLHVGSLPQQVNHLVNIFHKLAHNAQASNVLHVLFQELIADKPPTLLFDNRTDRFYPPRHEFNGRMLVCLLKLFTHPAKFDFQFPDRLFIWH